jgi:hypothetical protein
VTALLTWLRDTLGAAGTVTVGVLLVLALFAAVIAVLVRLDGRGW